MVPRGLEPRTLRLLAVRSNQLSYETLVICRARNLLSSWKSGRGIFCGVGGCSVLLPRGPAPPSPLPQKVRSCCSSRDGNGAATWHFWVRGEGGVGPMSFAGDTDVEQAGEVDKQVLWSA